MTNELWSGKRVAVLGAGASGRAAARFLLDHDAEVTLADDADRGALAAEVEPLEASGATLAAGGLETAGEAFDVAVLSPGISIHDERVVRLQRAGVEVIGEVELASRYIEAPILAITGTNGKTTATHLAGRMLQASGKKVFVGGNVGTPLIEAVGGAWDALVVELSSFQLESIRQFRPKVAIWLNLTGDHLDRHGDLEGYAAAKAKIFENQTERDVAIVNRDDPLVWQEAKKGRATLLPYSTRMQLGVGAWLEGDEAVVLMPGTDGVRLPLNGIKLTGRHNQSNLLAACLGCVALGAELEAVWTAGSDFGGLPHRFETFLRWRDITFVDDSKATNVDAAVKAIEALDQPVVWLAGGTDKGAGFAPLRGPLQERARCAILVGDQTERMHTELKGAAPIVTASDWPEAVRLAVQAAQKGDTVLLSPAAASFDCFASYGERGDVFQRLCREETGRIEREQG